MFLDISEKEVELLKIRYKPGTKVRLLVMEDFQAPTPGTLGVVKTVDDAGTIHVNWENGSSLGIVYGQDICEIVA